MRYYFSDGGYIEENKVGAVYVGVIANECASVIRRTNCSVKTFMYYYKKQLQEAINNKLK